MGIVRLKMHCKGVRRGNVAAGERGGYGMTDKAWTSVLCVVSMAALLAAGCSGPGVDIAAIQPVGLQTIASDHISAVVLLKSWLNILYPSADGAGPCEPERHYERNPDGSIHFWGTNSDCSVYDHTTQADGSGQGTITFSDGSVAHFTWSAVTIVNGVMSQDVHQEFPDGVTLDFTFSIDPNPPDYGQSWTGSALMAKGQQMDYTMVRLPDKVDHLHVDLPDGSALDVRIPLTTAPGVRYWPIFDPGASGHFNAPGGERLDFALSGEDDYWSHWTFDTADGTSGVFELDEDFGGAGNLTRDGSVMAALLWQQDGTGTLSLVDAGAVDVTPSAAACDFQIDRWVASIAAMGPAPMY